MPKDSCWQTVNALRHVKATVGCQSAHHCFVQRCQRGMCELIDSSAFLSDIGEDLIQPVVVGKEVVVVVTIVDIRQEEYA